MSYEKNQSVETAEVTMARLYSADANQQQAESWMKKALAKHPKNEMVNVTQDQTKEARELLEKALQSDGRFINRRKAQQWLEEISAEAPCADRHRMLTDIRAKSCC